MDDHTVFGSCTNPKEMPAPVSVQDEQPARWCGWTIEALESAGNFVAVELAHDLNAARKRIAELEAKSFGQTIIDSLQEFNDSLQSTPVQKLATSGPSITRPVPAVDAWVTPAESSRFRYRVSTVETVNGETHIISGTLSICHDSDWLTGPSDRGPWRPIGEVR